MGDLMRQHTAQLILVGATQKSRGDVELATTRVGGIDVILIDDAHPHLVGPARMVHRLEKRYHHSTQTFCVNRVEAPRWGRGRRGVVVPLTGSPAARRG